MMFCQKSIDIMYCTRKTLTYQLRDPQNGSNLMTSKSVWRIGIPLSIIQLKQTYIIPNVYDLIKAKYYIQKSRNYSQIKGLGITYHLR